MSVELQVDGRPLRGEPGQSVAAALMGQGRLALRESPAGAPRGIYCGIGACQECRVHVEGLGVVRACLTEVRPGMRVTTGVP